jgi:H+/Cl- antiporter ClcA
MKNSAVIGGLAGAAALTVLHETVKKFDPKAPRMDLLGMMALSKVLRGLGKNPPPQNRLYLYTMAGDLISNALYYSLAGIGKKKSILEKGLALGIAAGLGAIFLPKPLHLNEEYSNRTTKTQVLTLTYYLVGSLVAAALIKRMQKDRV